MKILMTVLAGAAALLITAPPSQAVNPYPPGVCFAASGTQGVTQRKGVTCKQARKIVRAYYRADLPRRPECRGQGSIRWNGWKVRGIGTLGIATRFTKGRRSFRLSGGGAC